ncbi:transposase [Vagococcus fluvialis]|uniref:transposase n=1 Tax=Vagococcus fluvialis TaxID=2738 RepID=UPI0028908D8D|nr:transposase [Vagococcus fluvialis]MDT2781464.1 transposase [Vagococcus fluvialis]
MVDSSSDLKRKIITCLDQVFPEYEKIFSDIFGSSSTEILLNSPLPEDILQLDTELLIETIHLASKKRFGIERSEKKVMKLKELASNSFGISIAADVFKLEIQIMLEQIRLIERQIIQIESEIHEIIATQDNYLTTITGIGDITAAVIMGEIGDINRFKKPSQLLAFAGLDASVHQSGDFTGTKNKLSKRGSPYLRRAIWQAAFIAAFHDPALSIYYQKLKQRGKSHGTAVGAVSRKMVNIIFAVWTQNKPYEVHLPKNIDVN